MSKYSELLEAAEAVAPAKGGGGKYAALLEASEGDGEAEGGRDWRSLALEALDRLTPLGSAREIYGQLAGTRPSSGLAAGLAAADIASLGLAGKAKLAGSAARAGWRGVKQALAGGAGGGAAAWAAEEAGAGPLGTLAAGALGGSLAGGAVGAKLGEKPKLDPLRERLEALGARLTPAQVSGSGVAKAAEFSARANPLTAKALEARDEDFRQALQQMISRDLGPEALARRGAEGGASAAKALQGIVERRAANYAPALEELAKSKNFPGFKGELLRSVDAVAGDVSNSAYQAFKRALEVELKGKNTPMQLDKALTAVKARFQRELGGGPLMGQESRDFNVLMNALKDRFYEGLDVLSSEGVRGTKGYRKGNVGKLLREAKADYAEATRSAEPLADILASREGKPEAVISGLLGRGSEAVRGVLGQADKATASTLKGELALGILDEARGAGEAVNVRTLDRLLSKKYADIVPLLGERGEALKNMLKAAKIGGMTDISLENPSGTAGTLMRMLQAPQSLLAYGAGSLMHPGIALASGAKIAGDLVYTHAGRGLQDALAQARRVPVAPLRQGALAAGRQTEEDVSRREQEALRRLRMFRASLDR